MDTNDCVESQGVSTSETSTQISRKRKKNSKCWDSFTVLPIDADGKTYVQCKKCDKKYFFGPKTGTSTLLAHHNTCGGLGISPRTAARSSSFNYDEFRGLVIEAIIKHDLPFSFVEYEGIRAIFAYVSPRLRLPCRNTVKNHVRKMYEIEKSKVKDFLCNAKGRICLTSDIWTSDTTDGYLALTAHFLDTEWNLHKKVLNFCHMPPPHTGNALAEKISSLICDWEIDKNLFSITLDNASANDSFVGKLKTQLNFRKLLLMDGKFFHVRCCAHILNLIVQDGLKVIDDSVVKVRDSIKYIKGSIARKHKFLECVGHVGLSGDKRALRQDVPTRLNSTYMMLDSAIHYRETLGQMALVDSEFKTCPAPEEWDRIVVISMFLEEFYDVTSLFSGSMYPTANLFFPKVFKIQHSIQKAKTHDSEFMRNMGYMMSAKFDKYWSDYSLILGIAVVMDPRMKLEFVEWAYKLLYGEGSTELVKFKETLFSLFDSYMTRWSNKISLPPVQQKMSSSYLQKVEIFKDFDTSYGKGVRSSVKNELISYLEDQRLERMMDLDILSWWKNEQLKFPILSRMAGDMLMIPVSTVASESAFSIGGRVLDHNRSSLSPETVEALLCVRDWIFDKKYTESSIMNLEVEDALDLNTNGDGENENVVD